MKIVYGKKNHKSYSHVALENLVGATIEAVGADSVEGQNGDEPMTVLFMDNGTKHGFVHPSNDD